MVGLEAKNECKIAGLWVSPLKKPSRNIQVYSSIGIGYLVPIMDVKAFKENTIDELIERVLFSFDKVVWEAMHIEGVGDL